MPHKHASALAKGRSLAWRAQREGWPFVRKALAHALGRPLLARVIDRLNKSYAQFDQRQTVLVIGCPRSGSTWLMEALGSMPGYRTLYEPLHPRWYPEASSLGHDGRASMRVNGQGDDATEAYLEKVFRGGVVSRRPMFPFTRAELRKRITADKLVVKMVRANRIAPWIGATFALRGGLFVVRHPCAVISSCLRTGESGYMLPAFHYPSADQALREVDELDGFVDSEALKSRLLPRLTTKEAILAAIWALDHYVPLVATELPPSMMVVSYECLAETPGEVVNDIAPFLHLTTAETDTIRSALSPRHPSMSTRRPTGQPMATRTQVAEWKARIDDDQETSIREVLNLFSITFDQKSYTIGNRRFGPPA